MKRLCTLFLTLLFFGVVEAQVTNDDRVLIQGFYWESTQDRFEDWYEYVEGLATDMSNAGIDMIWLPPPSDAGAYEGYLPRELNNFDNAYGTLAEHQSLLNALNANGIDAIADIVVNHRVGSTNWIDFNNPSWGTNAITSDDEVWSNPDYSSIGLRGNPDTGTQYGPARDVDHTQTFVQNDIKTWMDNLMAFGYDGWRYDFVHGFDEYYITMYNNHTSPTFSVGEYWTNDKQTIQNWIDETGSTAFDFPTYYALKGVIRDNNYSYLAYQGAPSGGIGWDPRNYTTFIENHDTPDYDPSNNVLNGNNVGQAYAYLLTHPGVPTVFWSHMYEWGASVQNEIKESIRVRKEAGIHSQSAVSIIESQAGLYVARVTGSTKDVIIKMGYNNWGSPENEGQGGSWTLETFGNNYAIWSQGGGSPAGSMTVFAQNYTHVYAWDDNQNPLVGGWPGTALNIGSDGWNYLDIPADCSNVIFSNNGGNQTADLYTCNDAQYYSNGTWYADPPGGSNQLTVYAQGYTHAYAWDDNLNPLLGGWPGTAMNQGGTWNSITIAANCSNVIFSYNGGGQTADLYTCGPDSYWYSNSWSSTDPLAGARMTNGLVKEDLALVTSPNPFTTHATISFSIQEPQHVELWVYTLSGKGVQLFSEKVEAGTNQFTFSASDLPFAESIYIGKLKIGSQEWTQKLLIKR